MNRWLRNLISGAGSIIVITPSMSASRQQVFLDSMSIEDALRGDWIAVGQDLQTAIDIERNGAIHGAEEPREAGATIGSGNAS